MDRSYEELMRIDGYSNRLDYLLTNNNIGEETFGSNRGLNQMLYRLPEWRQLRSHIIIRDNGCDLAIPGLEIIGEPAYIHHINPITVNDILTHSSCLFDPNNLITVSFETHQAIHYSRKIVEKIIDRAPNDTCPWKG